MVWGVVVLVSWRPGGCFQSFCMSTCLMVPRLALQEMGRVK